MMICHGTSSLIPSVEFGMGGRGRGRPIKRFIDYNTSTDIEPDIRLDIMYCRNNVAVSTAVALYVMDMRFLDCTINMLLQVLKS